MNRSQENLKVAFYLRVSTDAQSVVHQRNELEKEGHYRGWKIVGEYVDTSSGARCSRVGIDALMRDIRCHRVRTVACVTLDRLARSMSNFSSVVGEFDLHGVALIVPRQQIDTSDTTPAGRLTMHILMAMAEFQLSLIREATKSGLRAARARGAKIGRPATKARVPSIGSSTHAKRAVTAIEIGMMSFEAAFLSHLLLPSGLRVIEHVEKTKMLPAPEPQA